MSGRYARPTLVCPGYAGYREFTDALPLTDAARALPNLRGAGMVRDLREAASLDGQIAANIDSLTENLSRSQMMTALDEIITRWADTSGRRYLLSDWRGDYNPSRSYMR